MIKHWLFGRKYCAKALISKGVGWTPTERYFWSGGLLTGRKINIIKILMGRRVLERNRVYLLDDLQLNRLGTLETIKFNPYELIPKFIWPKELWDNG